MTVQLEGLFLNFQTRKHPVQVYHVAILIEEKHSYNVKYTIFALHILY
jgi:hypothetical protein